MHHPKLTNQQLFDDSLNASATFVAVVSSKNILNGCTIKCVDDDVLFLSLDIPDRFHLIFLFFSHRVFFYHDISINLCKTLCCVIGRR